MSRSNFFCMPRWRSSTRHHRLPPPLPCKLLQGSAIAHPPPSSRPASPFSTNNTHLARKAQAPKSDQNRGDSRITLIRYFLAHPVVPRPLRLSRLRSLRHWTIHRAWLLFRAQQRRRDELTLERQYNSMKGACEALRLMGEDGLVLDEFGKSVPPPGARDLKTVQIRWPSGRSNEGEDGSSADGRGDEGELVEIDVQAAAQRQQEIGKLYRIALEKKGVYQGVPIEYARCQTDTPPRSGWNHDWTR